MLRDQTTLGKFPWIVVMVAITTANVLAGMTYYVYASRPGIIQHPEIFSPVLVNPKQFDPDYHIAVGQRFLNTLENYNRFNFQRQMGNAGEMVAEPVRRALYQRYLSNEAFVTKMKVTRKPAIEKTEVSRVDKRHQVTDVAYLVRMDEWWSGVKQFPSWSWVTLRIAETTATASDRLAAQIESYDSRDVTDAVMKERGLSTEDAKGDNGDAPVSEADKIQDAPAGAVSDPLATPPAPTPSAEPGVNPPAPPAAASTQPMPTPQKDSK